MAVLDTHRAPTALSVLSDRFGAGVTFALRGLADWHDLAMTRRQLKSLSDHQLDDIGLHRGAIDEIGYHRSNW